MPPSAEVRARRTAINGPRRDRIAPAGLSVALPDHDDLFAGLAEVQFEPRLALEHLSGRKTLAKLGEFEVLDLELIGLRLETIDLLLHGTVAHDLARKSPTADGEHYEVRGEHPFEADEPTKPAGLSLASKRHTDVLVSSRPPSRDPVPRCHPGPGAGIQKKCGRSGFRVPARNDKLVAGPRVPASVERAAAGMTARKHYSRRGAKIPARPSRRASAIRYPSRPSRRVRRPECRTRSPPAGRPRTRAPRCR